MEGLTVQISEYQIPCVGERATPRDFVNIREAVCLPHPLDDLTFHYHVQPEYSRRPLPKGVNLDTRAADKRVAEIAETLNSVIFHVSRVHCP